MNRDTPLELFEKGTQLTRLGLGFPQYENDDVAIPALMDWGYAEEDARNYAMAACWEFIIPKRGMEIPNIGALPFANITDQMIREKLISCASMDDLKEAIEREIKKSVAETMVERHDLYVIPSPYISLFFEGCLENKKDISLGSKYNNWGLHGTGLAPAADMLAAVDAVVFHGDVDRKTLLDAMNADFVGYEELHDRLKYHTPKMGNDDDRADRYASWLLSAFADAVRGLKNERGGIVRAGTGSAMYYIFHAKDLGATADGKRACHCPPITLRPSISA